MNRKSMAMKSSPSVNSNRVRNPGAGDLGPKTPAPRKAPAAKARAATTTAAAKATPPALATAPRRTAPVALLEEHSRDGELRSVTIECVAPAARDVCLAGTFNDWQPRATPMARQRNGRWIASVLLRPGAHEYRLVVDGQWQEDPMAQRFAPNPFGGRNSIIEVAAAP